MKMNGTQEQATIKTRSISTYNRSKLGKIVDKQGISKAKIHHSKAFKVTERKIGAKGSETIRKRAGTTIHLKRRHNR